MEQGLTGIEFLSFPIQDDRNHIWIPVNANKVNFLQNDKFFSIGKQNGLIDDHIDRILVYGNTLGLIRDGLGISFYNKEKIVSLKIGKQVEKGEAIIGFLGKNTTFIIVTNQGKFYLLNDKFDIINIFQEINLYEKEVITQVLSNKKQTKHYFITNLGRIICRGQEEIITYSPNLDIYTWKIIGDKLVGYSNKYNCLYTYQEKWETKKVEVFNASIIPTNTYCLLLQRKDAKGATNIISLNENLIFENACNIKLSYEIVGGMIDNMGCIWLSSKNGLIKVFPYIYLYSTKDYFDFDGLQAIFKDSKGRIWIGSENKGLSYIENEHVYKASSNIFPFKNIYPGNVSLGGEVLFSAQESKGIVALSDIDKWRNYASGIKGYYYAMLSDGRLAVGSVGRGIAIRNAPLTEGGKWEFKDSSKGYLFENALTIVEDSFKRIWSGRLNKGIAIYDRLRDTVFSLSIKSFEGFGIEAGVCDKHGNVWLGGDGLHFFKNKQNIDVSKISFKDFKPIKSEILTSEDKKIYAMAIVKGDYLLIGTQKGLGIINIDKFYNNSSQEMLFFNNNNGFSGAACEQNTILATNEGVWVGHDDGLTFFDYKLIKKGFQNTDSLTVSLDSIWAGKDRLYPKLETIDIGQRNVSMRFFFSCSNISVVGYFYTMNGLTQYTTNNYIELPSNLTSGKHTITIYALGANGLLSEQKRIIFEIPYPFHLTIEFYIFIFAIIVIAALIFIYMKKKEERRRLEVAKLQVEAVISHMNPHFIKNSFGWLQARLLNLNDKEGVTFVARLAENTSIIFQSAIEKRPFHTLENELILVKNYLTLQSFRFKNKFSVILPNEQNILHLLAYKIPIMQIQIHCENGIEHGLGNKEVGNGTLQVTITEDKNYIYICIEDDGIGIEKAKQMGSKGTQQGTKMLKKLHDVFNEINYKSTFKISSEYQPTNLVNEQQEPYGTKVYISIPKNFNYEF